jgi:hypothetical protein
MSVNVTPKCLLYIQKQAEKKSQLVRDAQLFQDRAEWAKLNDESKQFILNYLNQDE